MKTSIEVFRDAVLADARAATRRRLEAARHDAHERIGEARKQARWLIENARQEGREAALREMRRQRVEARRQAHGIVLNARREALERLRERTLARLRGRRGDGADERLAERLQELARRQLGDEIEIEREPDGGGLIAHRGARLVDYRLSALVDRAMDDLGPELEELWR
jgi:vacuolar-type H+-ATPase subunit E/Vma4